MSPRGLTQVGIVLFGCSCVLAGPARATTFVRMDDERMLRASAAVVVGTVTKIESANSGSEGAIYTYVRVKLERIIKGHIHRYSVELREPGGRMGDRVEWVYGAPEFWVGERSLLFLSRNRDGSLQTTNLSMGKYTIGVDMAGHTTAVRDFGYGAAVLDPDTGEMSEGQPETRPYAPFVKHLLVLSAKENPATGPELPLRAVPPELAGATTQIHEAFVFLSSPPARWFEPDSGLPVTYLIDRTGDSKLGPAASRAAVDAAMAAWTNVPTSSLILQDGGTTAPGPFSQCTTNRIVFNDPNSEIGDPIGCGGILAIGGYCGGGGSKVVNGTTFGRIVVGKATFNNGWSGCALWTQCNVAEVATHELGHTIGLGHSTDRNATMNAVAHFDGRCAGLATDDANAITFMYPQVGTPPPTPTWTATGTPTPTHVPTHTPTATMSRTATNAPTQTPTLVPSYTPTQTPTPTVMTLTPSETPTATETNTPLPPGVPSQTSTSTATVPPTPTSLRSSPPNDACTNATTVLVTPYSNSVTTLPATTEATDPTPSCGNGSRAKSAWWQFTAPLTGVLKANTLTSTYDTILSVYTGSCAAFTAVPGGCNDNASVSVIQSQLSFNAVAGQTYYFMVTASNADGGPTTFKLSY
jgi:hypothetical protein